MYFSNFMPDMQLRKKQPRSLRPLQRIHKKSLCRRWGTLYSSMVQYEWSSGRL